MIQLQKIYPSLDNFDLLPVDSVQSTFVQTKEGYLFCDLPKGFHIQVNKTMEKMECPYQNHHRIHLLFIDIAKKASIRYSTLSNLFQKLALEEFFECDFCTKKQKTCQHLETVFRSKYPHITKLCFELFYQYGIEEEEDFERVFETHTQYMNIILEQIRSPTLQQMIVFKIQTILKKMKTCVEKAIEENDDLQIQKCSLYFKSELSQEIDKKCSFVSLKKIDFRKWLFVLMYIFSLQKPLIIPIQNKFQSLKKTILLLYLYFHQKREMNIVYLEKINQRILLEMDTNELERVHPFLRGEYVQF